MATRRTASSGAEAGAPGMTAAFASGALVGGKVSSTGAGEEEAQAATKAANANGANFRKGFIRKGSFASVPENDGVRLFFQQLAPVAQATRCLREVTNRSVEVGTQ